MREYQKQNPKLCVDEFELKFMEGIRMIKNAESVSVYSNAKAMATILVVVAHATRMYTSGGAIPLEGNRILQMITDVIYLFHMPLFIFLSGAIYRQCIKNGKYRDFSSLVNKKARHLLIPYFFWGVFYVAPIVVGLNVTPLSLPKYIIFGIILMSTDQLKIHCDTRHFSPYML